ncbi:MAG: porin family protein [Deltaproteobacteria bacterium]|nr:porin family protein [Deltaproteobacteria bacterium]
MKKYLLATTAIVAMAGAASAADLPLKAAPAYVPVANWTGPYIGAHVGVGRMNSSCDQNGGYNYYSCGTYTGGVTTSDTGIVGGINAGYDWQDRNFVYGVIADWTWTNLKKTRSSSYSTYQLRTQVDWLASFRGRAGLAVDNTLVYLTGGVALGKVKAGGFGGPTTDFSNVCYGCVDKVKVGWVAGAGVEHKFNKTWSVNFEALYYDLGRETASTVYAGTSYVNEYHWEVFVARVGMNYRF